MLRRLLIIDICSGKKQCYLRFITSLCIRRHIYISPTNDGSPPVVVVVVVGGPCVLVYWNRNGYQLPQSIQCQGYFAEHDSCFTFGYVQALASCSTNRGRCLCLAIFRCYSDVGHAVMYQE